MKTILVAALLLGTTLCESDGDYCNAPTTQEEQALLSHVRKESKRLYHSLDCEGKNKAIALSKKYPDKNKAIEEAAIDMSHRQREEYPNQKDYQDQLQERSGQDEYDQRFGY